MTSPTSHVSYTHVEQIPLRVPELFEQLAPWNPHARLLEWLRPRVAELSYTSYELKPYARSLGSDGQPSQWVPRRRAVLRSEIDAAFFHLYGLDRDDTDYILGTFPIVNRKDMAAFGEERTRRLVLENYDRMAAATPEKPFVSSLDLPPGEGPRHPARWGR